jgi:hypothetical protein
MAEWRRAIELALGDEDTAKLPSVAQARSELASRVERTRILLTYPSNPSFFAVGRELGLHHQTVQRFVERAVVDGAMAALDAVRVLAGNPRSRSRPRISATPHELWTTWLLARHAREHGPAEGRACLANLAQGTVCKLYCLERRDPDFAEKIAKVLCVYRQVKVLKAAAASAKEQPGDTMAVVSYATRSPASRPSRPPPRTCRPNPACTRPSRVSTSTSAAARSLCRPASIWAIPAIYV